MTDCEPGKHRTLVEIDTGTPLKNIHHVPYICLNCGQPFVGVQVRVEDEDIEAVLKLAAKNTVANLKTLRITKK